MLVLEVVSGHAAFLGRASRCEFDFVDTASYRIGRGDHNDWDLPLPTVSRDQATIIGYHGLYMLEATGRQAVAVNDRSHPVPRGRLVRLSQGDRLMIDELEIVVAEQADDTPPIFSRDPPVPVDETPRANYPESTSDGPEIDPTAIARVPSRVLPEDEFAGALDEVWRAAGIDPGRVASSPALARELGAVLRAAVRGLHEGLAARMAVRRGYRVPLTQVAGTDNNPLKFTATPDQALEHLLVTHPVGFIGLQRAVEEAFRDLRDHQLAVLKGEEAAFESLLGEFDPETLERRLSGDPGSHSGKPVRGGRGKWWDGYRKLYAELRADEDRTFRQLFAKPFAKAYERELDRVQRQPHDSEGDSQC